STLAGGEGGRHALARAAAGAAHARGQTVLLYARLELTRHDQSGARALRKSACRWRVDARRWCAKRRPHAGRRAGAWLRLLRLLLAQHVRPHWLRRTLRPRGERGAIVGFVMNAAHPHDLTTFADQQGVALRGGHHCNQPLMRRFGVPGTTRASFYFYNTKEEIDRMIDILGDAVRFFSPKGGRSSVGAMS